MEALIKFIEKEDLSNIELIERLMFSYDISKHLYKVLTKKLKKLYYKEHPKEKELNEFYLGSYFNMSTATEEFGKFKRGIEFNTENRNSKFWNTMVEESYKIHTMETRRYEYLAYKRVLESNLGALGYQYYEDKK